MQLIQLPGTSLGMIAVSPEDSSELILATHLGGKPMWIKSCRRGFPSDGIESFAEIKFEDHRRGYTRMATIEQVSRIDKVFRNEAAIYEPCLVVLNKERYQGFQSICEELGNGFWRAILKGDGPEIILLIWLHYLSDGGP